MTKKLIILLSAMIVFCLMAVPVSAKAKTYKDITKEIKVKTLSQKQVKLKWKKHKVDKYIIYSYDDDEANEEDMKKLKTISGKKTSVVIKAKKNEFLQLYIKGINKSKKIQYEGWVFCNTGLETPCWVDFYDATAPCSPTSITVGLSVEYGQKPSGYQIYRKVKGAKKFKKIKTIKNKKRHFVWKDKSVKTGKAYVYKVRSFRGSGKKKYYSKMGNTMTRYAVNFKGKFAVSSDKNDDQITFKVTSEEKNGKTLIWMHSLAGCIILTDNPDYCFRIKSYSYDGASWISVKDQFEKDPYKIIKLNAGKALWFYAEKSELTEEDVEELDFHYENDYPDPFELRMDVHYRDALSIMSIHLSDDSIDVDLDYDAI